MKLHKACTVFCAEITLCDGSVQVLKARSLSALQKSINERYDYSSIHDYMIHESAYYEIVPEVD